MMLTCSKKISSTVANTWSCRTGMTGRIIVTERQSCRFMSKLRDSAEAAFDGLNLQGATIAVGGFGLGGVPETLLHALSRNDRARDLTVISLTAGTDELGVGQLIRAGKVRRLIAAYVVRTYM